MKFRHIVSKGSKSKVRKLQALSLSEKKKKKSDRNLPPPPPPPSLMHDRVNSISPRFANPINSPVKIITNN